MCSCMFVSFYTGTLHRPERGVVCCESVELEASQRLSRCLIFSVFRPKHLPFISLQSNTTNAQLLKAPHPFFRPVEAFNFKSDIGVATVEHRKRMRQSADENVPASFANNRRFEVVV